MRVWGVSSLEVCGFYLALVCMEFDGVRIMIVNGIWGCMYGVWECTYEVCNVCGCM